MFLIIFFVRIWASLVSYNTNTILVFHIQFTVCPRNPVQFYIGTCHMKGTRLLGHTVLIKGETVSQISQDKLCAF